jgi:hypothetical protein
VQNFATLIEEKIDIKTIIPVSNLIELQIFENEYQSRPRKPSLLVRLGLGISASVIMYRQAKSAP